jgi:hypothetical protein
VASPLPNPNPTTRSKPKLKPKLEPDFAIRGLEAWNGDALAAPGRDGELAGDLRACLVRVVKSLTNTVALSFYLIKKF